jgi:fructose/tagatose bisphosphate aldolase
MANNSTMKKFISELALSFGTQHGAVRFGTVRFVMQTYKVGVSALLVTTHIYIIHGVCAIGKSGVVYSCIQHESL